MRYSLARLHPFEGQPPKTLRAHFFAVMHRARKLLAGRSEVEITAGIDVLNGIAQHPNFRHPLFEIINNFEPIAIPQEDGSFVDGMPGPTAVDLFRNNSDRIDLADFPSFPNGTWPELFAILSLSLVEKMCFEEYRQSQETLPRLIPRLDAEGMLVQATSYLKLATEAASIAEEKLRQLRISAEEQTKRQQSAGKKRHQGKSGPLKNRVQELYEAQYTNRTNRDAAKRILDDLEKNNEITFDHNGYNLAFRGQTALQTDEPLTRFEKWIAEFKKTTATT